MPAIGRFKVVQTREVEVTVVPIDDETYEEAALRIAERAFAKNDRVHGEMSTTAGPPRKLSTTIERTG